MARQPDPDLRRWWTELISEQPDSGLTIAQFCTASHWNALCCYTEGGDLSIDDNLSKRTLRCVAVGEKRIGCSSGSDRGGRTAATLVSLIASCKLLAPIPITVSATF